MADWYFPEISPLQEQRIPREEEISRQYCSLSEALAREFIQNAMDARTGEKLHVRISFGMASPSTREWVEGLYDHIEACRREKHRLPFDPQCYLNLLTEDWKYVAVEDFKTTGLIGETGNERSVPEESDFYDFIYWQGGSRKSGRKGGRWGVGKAVYHTCSKIRAFFALTMRYDDGKRLLIGKCVLAPHSLNGKRFDYAGYYREESGDPVTDPDLIEKFCIAFGVKRNEPGLSIVIPVLEDEITPDAMMSSIISHYFYPIARGVLSVQVNTPDRPVDIDSNTLAGVAGRLGWENTYWASRKREDVEKLIRFVYRCLQSPSLIKISSSCSSPDELINSLPGADEIRPRYLRGEVLAFEVPVAIKLRKGKELASSFVVYLQREEGLRDPDVFFIRSDILVPGPAKKLRGRCVRGMLVADEEAIAQFLGDAETPFHDDWSERTTGLTEKYENPRNILALVRKAPLLIADWLEGLAEEERGWELFKEYFSLPDEVPREGPITPRKPSIETEKGIRLLRLEGGKGGFTLLLTPEGKEMLPLTVSIRLAYATVRENPMRHYRPEDFDVSTLPVRFQGCSILTRRHNLIELEIASPDFRLEVDGFDERRELEVHLEVKKYGRETRRS